MYFYKNIYLNLSYNFKHKLKQKVGYLKLMFILKYKIIKREIQQFPRLYGNYFNPIDVPCLYLIMVIENDEIIAINSTVQIAYNCYTFFRDANHVKTKDTQELVCEYAWVDKPHDGIPR